MHESFNPYVAWLGIAQPGGRPNHYALLGLKLFESDPARIAAAAERQMAKVFKVQAGAQQTLWQQVLAEIGEAKQTLSDMTLKNRYDEQLRGELALPDGVPTAKRPTGVPAGGVNLLPPGTNVLPPKAATPSPKSGPARSAESQGAPTSSAGAPRDSQRRPTGRSVGATPLLPPVGKTIDPSEVIARSTRTRANSTADASPSEALGDAQCGAAEFTDLADPMAPVEDLLPPEAIAPAASTPTPAPEPASAVYSGDLGAPQTAGVSGMRSVGYGIAIRRRRGQERLLVALMALLVLAAAAMAAGYVTGFIRFGAPAEVAHSENGVDDVTPDASSDPAAERAGDPRGVVPAVQDSQTGVKGNGDSHADQRPRTAKSDGSNTLTDVTAGKTSASSGKRETPSKSPPPDPAQVAKFQGTLAAARGALGRRDYTAAKAHIDRAKQLAVSDEQSDMVKGFESLAEHVKGFWDAVRDGTEGLENAGELQIGSTIVSIVEVGKNHLVIRAAGQNRRHALDQLPAGLAVAIAKRWFDERADNKVFLGAFHFVDPRTDVGDAKRLWEEASGAGLDVKRLLSLLPIAEVKEPSGESAEP